jgi:ferredoxin
VEITVDPDTCCGYGDCVLTAPELFDLGGDGVAVLLVEEVREDQRADVEAAAASCPVAAIVVHG